jgi:putative DNA primase/helicase
MSDPFAPLGNGGEAKDHKAVASIEAWVPIVPVPASAPPKPDTHSRLGKPKSIWCYRDAAGATLGYVCRFDTEDGKVFQPLTYGHPAAGGQPSWRWKSWPEPRPLYGLQRLADRPDAPVIVAEGEKAADAAARLLPDFVVVTSPNGSKAAAKADWDSLRGRRVVIWPDADTAGLAYAAAVVRALRATGVKSVATVSPPAGGDVGWDAADAEADGWDGARADELVTAASSAEQSRPDSGRRPGAGDEAGGRKRVPQRDVLIALTEFCELWHDPNRTAYASFPVNAHRENWPIRSRDFEMWLSNGYYEKTGEPPNGQALKDAIRVLEARAVNSGPRYDPFIRVGDQDGRLYIDLCDEKWRAIEIAGSGWDVVEKPPVKFIRSPSMRLLSAPEAGGSIDRLRGFINASDEDFRLIVACLVASYRQRGPYPMLVLNGEQGSGKSMVSRMLRSLIDPSAAPIRAAPKDDRDLVVSAGNSWIIALDNLSTVPAWLSDALCRLCTGSGFATRMLHTDNSEMIFEAARPIILNGIPSLTDRPDLADRAVTVHLKMISETNRRPEDEIWSEFEAARPFIIGALCDAAASALNNVAKVKLDRSPRMADFVKWITAAEQGLGWEAGVFLDTYMRNRKDVSDNAFEADSVAVAVHDFVAKDHPTGWEGTASELLTAINSCVSESTRKARSWPATPQGLGNRIERIAPLLRAKGFAVEKKHSTVRTIIVVPPKNVTDPVRSPSAEGEIAF